MDRARVAAGCLGLLAWLTALAAEPTNAPPAASRRYLIDVPPTENRLPQNSVISLAQSRDGYLWLGTLNGLVRYDGLRFTVFDEDNTPGLKSSRIVSLFEDSRSNLWVGTERAGVALIQQDGIVSLGIGRGTREGRLVAACEDAYGAVWLHTADGQLWRCADPHTNQLFGSTERLSLTRALALESNGLLWVGVDRGLLGLDTARARTAASLREAAVQFVPTTKLDFLLASKSGGVWRLYNGVIEKWRGNERELKLGTYPWGQVSSVCEDAQGNLIVGTRGAGIYWYHSGGRVLTLSTNDGLSHSYVLSLSVDHEGTLWVGTDGGGLNRVRPQFISLLEVSRGWVVQSVVEDPGGALWIGANNGGIRHWKGGQFTNHYLPNATVFSVFADAKGGVWAGSGGLFQFHNDEFQTVLPGVEPTYSTVSVIHQDRAGRLWVGGQSGLARRDGERWTAFTTRNGLSADVVWAIADDAQGNLWVGTGGGGLNRLRNGEWQAFHKSDGLPSEDISSLYVDAQDVLWIGTFGRGLARFHQGRWTRYATREGLTSNSTGYLVEDSQGFLWIGSNAGLMRVPKQALNDFARGVTNYVPCRSYGMADGLPTDECTTGSQPGACRARDGRLWFPTIKGLVSVNPEELQLNPHAPPVVIESVFLDGQPYQTNELRSRWPEAVVIEARIERLEIHYTSLNLAGAERARFKYRLEGHENAWIEAGNARVVRYSKLPFGRYRFHVIAANEDGVWNEQGSVLGFIVEPPFWRSWWFLSACVLGLLAAVIGTVYYFSTQKLQRQLTRLQQQEALQRERGRIARDLHDQLGASLTQVALLGEMAESDKDLPKEVEAHAKQIAQTARDTTRMLDEIVWTVNPSNDTLDSLVTYICKYAQDYLAVAGLRYRLEVPAQLPATPLPPEVRHNVFLAVKEAITNVVRHSHGSEGRLRLRLGNGQFTLEVADNGQGIDLTAPETRNGLRNMRKRMEDIGGVMKIERVPEGGTVVQLTVPLDRTP